MSIRKLYIFVTKHQQRLHNDRQGNYLYSRKNLIKLKSMGYAFSVIILTVLSTVVRVT